MASRGKGNAKIPTNFRPRDPLNVVVEKVGTTRALVHGDISTESLRELLMSPLEPLPKPELFKTEPQDVTDPHSAFGTEEKKLKEAIESSNVAGSLDNHQRTTTDEKNLGRNFLADVTSAAQGIKKTKSKSGKMEGQQNSQTFSGSRTGLKRKPGEHNGKGDAGHEKRQGKEEEDEEEEDDEEEDGATVKSSLSSCLISNDCEMLPLSCDGRWLWTHFRKPLVSALRDIVNKKPEDPVSYLAFWLRKYRNEEEKQQRQRDLDNELRAQRNTSMLQKEPTEEFEPEYNCTGEESGGDADWNFKNYHPSTPVDEEP